MIPKIDYYISQFDWNTRLMCITVSSICIHRQYKVSPLNGALKSVQKTHVSRQLWTIMHVNSDEGKSSCARFSSSVAVVELFLVMSML